MRGSLAIGLLLTLAASGCVGSTNLQAYRPKNPDEALVVSTLLKIPNGLNSKSVDLLLQPYADDVYVGNFHKYLGVAGPTAPRIISKADLRSVYTEMLRSVKDVTMDVKDVRLTVSGDRAVAEARTELLYKLEAGRRESRQETFRNDVLWRLRRTIAGWKIVEEIWQ